YLDDRRIVTGRRYPLKSIRALRDAVREGGVPCGGTVELAAHLFRRLGEALQGVISSLESEIDDIQDRVLSQRGQNDRARLATLRRLAARLDRHFATGRISLARFLAHPPAWLGDVGRAALAEAADGLGAVVEDLDHLQERTKLL